MARYRRSLVCGGYYFFTINMLERDGSLLVDHIDVLRRAPGGGGGKEGAAFSY